VTEMRAEQPELGRYSFRKSSQQPNASAVLVLPHAGARDERVDHNNIHLIRPRQD